MGRRGVSTSDLQNFAQSPILHFRRPVRFPLDLVNSSLSRRLGSCTMRSMPSSSLAISSSWPGQASVRAVAQRRLLCDPKTSVRSATSGADCPPRKRLRCYIHWQSARPTGWVQVSGHPPPAAPRSSAHPLRLANALGRTSPRSLRGRGGKARVPSAVFAGFQPESRMPSQNLKRCNAKPLPEPSTTSGALSANVSAPSRLPSAKTTCLLRI